MPQITEAEWKKQLEKGVLKGFYFVYGPEKYLVQRSAARVKEKASEGDVYKRQAPYTAPAG